MLKNIVESKLSTNLLIIEDNEDISGHELFTATLLNHVDNEGIKEIYFLCYENPPQFYIDKDKLPNKVITKFFTDPNGWSDSSQYSSLESFLSNAGDLSRSVVFIDSVTFLVEYYGFCSVYNMLHRLKGTVKGVVCLTHGALLTFRNLEDLEYLSTGYVKLLEENFDGSRIADVVYKKFGGKIVKQREIFLVTGELKVSSKVKQGESAKVSADVTDEIKTLTTFKLGLEMNENERRAKEDLVLPYLRTEKKTTESTAEVIYHPEADELEDDPDDDLDI